MSLIENIVFANDIDKEACLSYQKNIGNHIVCEDIYKLDSKTIPNADILSGYDIKHKILNASDYLVPQNRKRVIILGKRKDIQNDINFPKPLKQIKILKDAIFDLPNEYSESIPNHTGSKHKIQITGYIGNRILEWDKPAPTITGRGSNEPLHSK